MQSASAPSAPSAGIVNRLQQFNHASLSRERSFQSLTLRVPSPHQVREERTVRASKSSKAENCAKCQGCELCVFLLHSCFDSVASQVLSPSQFPLIPRFFQFLSFSKDICIDSQRRWM